MNSPKGTPMSDDHAAFTAVAFELWLDGQIYPAIRDGQLYWLAVDEEDAA